MSKKADKHLTEGELLILDKLDALETRLTALEEKLEERLPDMRPLWMQVLPRLEGLQASKADLLAWIEADQRREHIN